MLCSRSISWHFSPGPYSLPSKEFYLTLSAEGKGSHQWIGQIFQASSRGFRNLQSNSLVVGSPCSISKFILACSGHSLHSWLRTVLLFKVFSFQLIINYDIGSAVAVKHIFSGGRDTISLRWASLQPETIKVLMLVKKKLHLARSQSTAALRHWPLGCWVVKV